ncbi:CU044_5270 family protein [Actinomadura sp. K4S16]|uniref:CU044_5270 family protein n=1 Tax=Actinomadura sp. K4S16 TaxID=1316147 RepID=UPI0011EC4900|nr:CU044_5270 family protein [Actinomadura sp. K4S16]
MDELRAISEAYGEPAPPTLREMTEARARMFQEPASRRRVRLGWRFKAGLGVVASGAAVAVAVTVTGSGSPAPPAPAVDLGRQAVLAAAEKAAAQPTGKYWFSDQIQGQSYIMRPKTGAYAIVGAHSETFFWSAAERGGGNVGYGRDLPARPFTERDAAAWRRAGSPKEFRVWSNDHYWTYAQKATKWETDDPDGEGGGRFYVQGTGGKELTVEEIQNLPDDPDALARMFFTLDTPRDRLIARRAKRASPALPASRWLGVTASLLEDVPLPPRVRAGLMRALAAQPGVRSLGAATDPLGRTGVALAVDNPVAKVDGEFGAPPQERGEYRSRSELVFDKETGELLAEQDVLTVPGGAYREQPPGFVINYWVVRDTGWTDTVPKPPAKLPF